MNDATHDTTIDEETCSLILSECRKYKLPISFSLGYHAYSKVPMLTINLLDSACNVISSIRKDILDINLIHQDLQDARLKHIRKMIEKSICELVLATRRSND